MVNYFIRRLLLMIPTFLGSTVLVFTILQMAPGGPIEQMMLELQMGGAVVGEGGAGSSSGVTGGVSLPPKALKELERFYGFDKPIYQRSTKKWYSDYKSASSVERIEAFIELGRKDPVEYVDGWEVAKKHVEELLANHA